MDNQVQTKEITTQRDGITRKCKLCFEEKSVSEFRIGPGGRLKTICEECINVLLTSYYGNGNLRQCATCKKPTINYRCSRCWRKIREGTEDEITSADPYQVGLDR